MKDKRRRWPLILSAILALSLALTGCGGNAEAPTQDAQPTEPAYQDVVADGNYTQTQLQALLDDPSVTEIEITGMIGLNRPLNVTGSKTIKGDGMLVLVGDEVKNQVATTLPAYASGAEDVLTDWVLTEPDMTGCNYAVVVSDGGSLTLAGAVTVCANYAGESLLIEQGGAVSLTEEAVVNRSVNTNIVNNGTLTVSGGSLAESNGYHIINNGTLEISGGTVTGSGSGCAAVYSTGTVTMSGGLVQQAKIHGFYLASGSMTLSGGEISACEKDGIFVGKAATLNTTSSAAKVRQHGRNGVMNLGVTVIDAGRFNVNGEANVKNGVGGTMTINGGNITDSSWAGVYNAGQMEIHGGNIATNTYGGIVNTGDLTMDGGSLYANSGTAQLVNRGGNLKVTGQEVSVTSGKSVGIMNDLGGYAEITDIILMDQQAAHIRNWGEMYLHDLTMDNNSTSSAIYNDCGGHLKAERVTITNSYVHGVYNVAEATAELIDVTIETVGSRGVQNKGGTVIATNLYVNKSKGVAVGNDNDKDGDSGNVTIAGLEVPYSYSGAIINQCGGTLTVSGAYVGATEKTAVKIEGGRTIIDGMTISRTVSTGDSVTHAIYLEGGYLCISNSYIANPTGCTLQNKAGTVVGYNLVLENSTNVAISNRYADDNKNQVGSVTIDGLTVRGTVKSGNIANVAGELVIKNATLETTSTTNVSVSGGSAVLENVKILGCTAASSPCLSVYNDAVVTLRGEDSEISGAVWRPVNIGTNGTNGSTGGTFIYEGGKIMAADESEAAVRLASDGAVMAVSGDPQITGIVNYESEDALISIAGELSAETLITINPVIYMDGLQVLTADDSALLEGNYQKFQLAVPNSVYEIGSNGKLKLKDGVSIVARNQATGKEYATLADAIAEVSTDGTETVIEVLGDIALTSNVIVADGRNIVLTDDGAARTISRDFTSSTNNQNMMFYIDAGSTVTFRGTETGGLILRGMGEDNTENADKYRVVVRVGTKAGDGAKLIIEDGVTITGNYSEQAGGVALVYGTVEMNGGTIAGNKTTKNGGVFQMASGSSVIINDGSITGNSAGGTGGVFQISANAALTVNGGEISGNSSGGAGGVVQVAANGSLTINGGTISGNHSGTEMNGGAIQLANNAAMVMTGGSITGNTAEKNGGGINVNNSTVTITGGTITGNTAGGTGADVNVANKSAVVNVSGSTVTGNIYLVNESKVTVSGGAALGEVTYGGTDAAIVVGGELTAETVATIVPSAEAYDGAVVIESASAALWEGKFRLDAESIASGMAIIKDEASEDAVLFVPAPVVMPLELSVDGGASYTGYASLAEAIAAIPEGSSGIIRIKEDIEVLSALTVDKNVTITDDGTARAITAAGTMFKIANNCTLTLQGSAGLTLNGGNDRMIWVGSANGDTNAKLVINDGVTLTGTDAGKMAGSVAYTYGVIEMNGGLITGNVTTGNGTICVGGNQANPGSFTMTGGTISGNTANNGGGISAGNYTTVTITGGTITGNTAKASGGGIQIFNATVSISGATITNNTAATNGGNINMGNASATVTVTDTTVSGGTVGETANDVFVIAKGTLTLAGSSSMGNVKLAAATSLINVSGVLSAETVAVIDTAAAEGTTILTGDTAENHTKFALTEAMTEGGYYLDENGILCLKTEGDEPAAATVTINGETVAFPSLAAALNAVEAGQTATITVMADTELGAVEINGKHITLTDGGKGYIITRSGTDSLFTITGGGSLTISGTLKLAGNTGNRMIAVGVDANDRDSKLVINDSVTISGVDTTQAGSAFYTYGIVEMNGGTITGNTTTSNGTVFVGGTGSFTMTGGTISGNTAVNGGGICLAKTANTAEITGGTITGNNATAGGGIYVYANATLAVGGTVQITNNTATGNGGGIQIAGGTVTVNGGTISGNSGVYGGGICIAGSQKLTINDCTIKDNSASNAGAGDNVHISGSAELTMTGGTLSGTEQDLVVAAKGKLNISGDAVVGNVMLPKTTSVINIAGTLTQELCATITTKEHVAGSTVLTGDLTQYQKFALADSAYIIDENGKLQPGAAAASEDEEV